MLIDPSRSALLVVDVQTGLMPVIERADQAVTEIAWLAAVAEHLAVPVWLTEQYPEGLGPTEPRLRDALPQTVPVFIKQHFDACRAADFVAHLEASERRQIVIAGAEAHICVLQTALGLRQRGLEVFWLVEGCVSRRLDEAKLARERLLQAGGVAVSADMVAYEWLETCSGETFREIHRRLLKPRAGRPLRLAP
ncbi:isochorismatase family protein [Halomonas sp. V046]|uniref:isochorismatase family protein n=1 Tax=Halomonas sp. V046 TaxID=3459611 RepID=UPI00404419E0